MNNLIESSANCKNVCECYDPIILLEDRMISGRRRVYIVTQCKNCGRIFNQRS